MTWQLREATTDDLDAVMAIEQAVFGTDAWSAATMRSELEAEHTHYLVAFRPETPHAVEAYAGLLSPRGARDADIQTIAVAESARRAGLGRTLMLTLVAIARGRGAQEVFLEVRADNSAAQSLYLALGFEKIGVRARYYEPDGVDAHVMRLRIPPPTTTPAEAPDA